nr:immunoglobulin heavy chain junction region [Mus musculus]
CVRDPTAQATGAMDYW